MKLIEHDLPHFFKYTSSSTAKKIIPSQAFRWTSPLLFNDPFDHQANLTFTFSGSELAKAIEQLVVSVLDGKSFEPSRSTDLGMMLSHIRKRRHKPPRDELLGVIRAAGLDMAKTFASNCEMLNDNVVDFLTKSRVLCLSENHDNVVMWSHYGEEHKGAVFKLRRLEKHDHPFLLAQQGERAVIPS